MNGMNGHHVGIGASSILYVGKLIKLLFPILYTGTMKVATCENSGLHNGGSLYTILDLQWISKISLTLQNSLFLKLNWIYIINSVVPTIV